MISNLRLRLICLMTVLLASAMSVGGVAIWGTWNQNCILETVSESTSLLAQSAEPIHSSFENLAARVDEIEGIAAEVEQQFGDVVALMEQSDAASDAANSESMQALAVTGFQLIDRHLDRLKLLADALAKSYEVRNGIRGFQETSLRELGIANGQNSDNQEVDADDQAAVTAEIEALLSSANADVYVMIGLNRSCRGIGLYSNQEGLFGADLSDSHLFREVLLENRITKGLDRIANELILGAATIIRSTDGEEVAVLLCGSKLDLSSLRFLSSDLHAELALLHADEAPSQFRPVHSTFQENKELPPHPITLPPNVVQHFEKLISANSNSTSSGVNGFGLTTRENLVAFSNIEVGPKTFSTSFQLLLTNDQKPLGLLAVGRDIQTQLEQRFKISVKSNMAKDHVRWMRENRNAIHQANLLQSHAVRHATLSNQREELRLEQLVSQARDLTRLSQTTVVSVLGVIAFFYIAIIAFMHHRVLRPFEAAYASELETKQQLQERAEELKQAMLLADASNLSKSEFLANMSHEIRTPMTSILGFADLVIEDSAVPLSRQQRSYLETIKSSGNHLLSIINDILDISKIEAGKLTVDKVDTELEPLIKEVLKLMLERIKIKGLELQVLCASEIPKIIYTDPLRLKQILVNLLGNAIKFTDNGYVCIKLAMDGDRQLRIAVIDTGVGLKEEQVARLFRPFEQADNSITRKYGGSGLGLLISKRLANLLDGDIQVYSQYGQGSCFEVRLPIPPRDGEEYFSKIAIPSHSCLRAINTTQCDTASLEAPHALAGIRILLAEDGLDNQRLISFHLKKAGASVTIVGNGKLAVEHLTTEGDVHSPLKKNLPVDLLILDMQMPEMDGYTTASILREKGCDLPILALTAHAMKSDQLKCLNAGCSAYQSKPIEKSLLVSECQALVRASLQPKVPTEAPRPTIDLPSDQELSPIVSQLAGHSDMTELIDYFIDSLQNVIATLLTEYEQGNFAEIGRLAHQLKGAGTGYGFPAVTEAANKVSVRVQAKLDAKGLKEPLEDLIRVCRSVVLSSDSATSPSNLNPLGTVP